LALVALAAGPAQGQWVEGRVGRAFLSPDFTVAALGYTPVLWGPLRLTASALLLAGERTDLYGATAEAGVTVAGGWNLVGGVGGGIASGERSGDWGTWSAGLGYDLVRRPFRLGLEGRWREITDWREGGVEVTARVAVGVGRRGRERTRALAPTPDPRALTVVDLALATMGTPYLWGGTDANGFDCSGLIQHAYATAGVVLPRTSREQALAGNPVAREIAALLPGDILTFASSRTQVTHVGLYLGDLRFIHATGTGVRVSRLSPDDPDGRWWFERWVGARRPLPVR
jgi:cell wall-associated NlpC family hydrolase